MLAGDDAAFFWQISRADNSMVDATKFFQHPQPNNRPNLCAVIGHFAVTGDEYREINYWNYRAPNVDEKPEEQGSKHVKPISLGGEFWFF